MTRYKGVGGSHGSANEIEDNVAEGNKNRLKLRSQDRKSKGRQASPTKLTS